MNQYDVKENVLTAFIVNLSTELFVSNGTDSVLCLLQDTHNIPVILYTNTICFLIAVVNFRVVAK